MTSVMPARGKVLIKKPNTEETLPGGRIVIPEQARERYAANQFEIVEVGDDPFCDYPDDCSCETHRFLSLRDVVHPLDSRIIAGAWVIVRPRCLVDAGDGLYLVNHNDILGVFSVDDSSGRDRQTVPPENVHGVRRDTRRGVARSGRD